MPRKKVGALLFGIRMRDSVPGIHAYFDGDLKSDAYRDLHKHALRYCRNSRIILLPPDSSDADPLGQAGFMIWVNPLGKDEYGKDFQVWVENEAWRHKCCIFSRPKEMIETFESDVITEKVLRS